MTSAALCRRRGYRVGDVLRAGRVDSDNVAIVRITAIGETEVLGIWEQPPFEGEVLWDLSFRRWRRIARAKKGGGR